MDDTGYHKMQENTTSQIDTSKKVCYDCKKPAIIIINKYYYCAPCGLDRQKEEDYMDWLKTIGTRKDRTPEERLYIAKDTNTDGRFIWYVCRHWWLNDFTARKKHDAQLQRIGLRQKSVNGFCDMAGTTL